MILNCFYYCELHKKDLHNSCIRANMTPMKGICYEKRNII